jgi:hypothetical protein
VLSSASKDVNKEGNSVWRRVRIPPPASRRRRRTANPVPGDTTGPPSSWGILIRGLCPPSWGSFERETVKCGHEPRGTRTREWLLWRGPASIANDRPIFSSERTIIASVQLKKISGCGPQGAWSQEELIGCKPSVVK